MQELLAPYPVVIEIPLHWGEMDAFNHVNNVVYFRYFESARMAYFQKINYMKVFEETGIGPILAATRCKFKFPLVYPDTVWVGARVTEVDSDRFMMQYVVVSQQVQKVAAEGEGQVVSYDFGKGSKTALPEVIRKAIVALEESAPTGSE